MATVITSTTDSAENVTRAKGMYSKAQAEEKSATPEKKEVEKTEAPEAPEKEAEIEEPEQSEEIEDGEAEESAEEKADAKPKKKGGFQKRIDKLTKGKTLAEQERDYWKEQALRAGTKTAEKPDPVENKTTAKKDAKPDPDDFKTVGEYLEAVVDWKNEQKANQAEMNKKVEAAKTEQQKTISTFREKVKKFQESAKDLPEVLEAVDHIALSPALEDIFLTSDNGPELMYDLAKDPEEYERISKLSPTATFREMGKREARMASAEAPATTETKTTKAPPPLKPVTGKGAAPSTKDPGEMTFQEYKAWHAKKFGR